MPVEGEKFVWIKPRNFSGGPQFHNVLHLKRNAFLCIFENVRRLFKKISYLIPLLFTSCLWNQPVYSSAESAYLPLDDSEYPYAEIPRIVIETENFREVRNRTTKIPARLQIYGKDAPASDIWELTVRGRGNTSFNVPKYSLKLEFTDKVSPLGMPKNRDWLLLSDYGDKTHLRNWMKTRLSNWLGAKYTPRMQYVELYLNREYKGVYMLSENIKIAKKRLDIPENDSSFLFEKEDSKKYDEPYFKTLDGNIIHIQSPKNISKASMAMAKSHLDSFETYLHKRNFWGKDSIANWLDIEDFLLNYWVQEFAKNEDGKFTRSVFFYWEKGGTIHFGPLWDFDLSFGNESRAQFQMPENWFIRNYRWNLYILSDWKMRELAKEYWKEHREIFRMLIDSIPQYQKNISRSMQNEFKRWPILDNTYTWALRHSYKSHQEAVDSMISWTKKRFQWIDEHL